MDESDLDAMLSTFDVAWQNSVTPLFPVTVIEYETPPKKGFHNEKRNNDSMITLLENFKQTYKVAAMKNDGKIDSEEKRTLSRINAATD